MSSLQLTLSQLESWLWEAANILRGPVDAADFKPRDRRGKILFINAINEVTREQAIAQWRASSQALRTAMDDLFATREQERQP